MPIILDNVKPLHLGKFDKKNFKHLVTRYETDRVIDGMVLEINRVGNEIADMLNDEENNDFQLKNVPEEGMLWSDYWEFNLNEVNKTNNRYAEFECSFTNEMPDQNVGGYVFYNMTGVRLDQDNSHRVYPVYAPLIRWFDYGVGHWVTRTERANAAEGHRKYKEMVDEKMDIFKRLLMMEDLWK